MTAPLDSRLASTAVEAVLKAGEIQMSRFGQGVHVEKKGDIDLVTDVDVAVERMFRALVAERFPDHDVLGEEFGDSLKGSSHCWIFDPLDGTTNFAHGLPIFCASLGLEVDGVIRVAAVYDPTRRELFTAEAGQGAFLNGEPLRVSAAVSLLDSMLCTGFPYDVHRDRADIIGLFDAFVGRARAVRRLGSAALDLCYVAAGRLDGFWEQRLKPWDTCAGALVVAEAGGRVSGWRGEPYRASTRSPPRVERLDTRRVAGRDLGVRGRPFDGWDALTAAADSIENGNGS